MRHALEARARVGQSTHALGYLFALARGILLQQEGHRRRGCRQPTLADGTDACRDRIKSRSSATTSAIQRPRLDAYLAGQRTVDSRALADVPILLAVDQDARQIDVKTQQDAFMRRALDLAARFHEF